MNKISESADLRDNVILGDNVEIGEGSCVEAGCVIGNNVKIGCNVYIDYGAIIRDNVLIDNRGKIGARCILGEYLADFYETGKNDNHLLKIGKNALIRSESIIYGDNVIGDNFQTGHRVTIREKCIIGRNVKVGTLSDIQGYCEIGDYVNIHSSVHIGQASVVKKYVWLYPYVVLTNDPNPPSETMQGVTIKEFAVVATGSIVLPGITIGEEALVGAGAIVTKDVELATVVVGNPARVICKTDKVIDNITGKKVYPWKYTFDRGMPWQGIGYDTWEKENVE